MPGATLGPARHYRAGIVLVLSTLLFAIARPLPAQGVRARVSYRTRETVFITAGRAEGLAVGDTVTVQRADGTTLVSAVVVSVAQHTASARPLDPDQPVTAGLAVTFTPHPAEMAVADSAGIAPPPDTAVALDSGYAVEPLPEARSPPRRWSGGVHLEQDASSSGASSELRMQQTVAAMDLDAPIAPGVNVRVRSTTRWRSGASRTLVGTPALTTIPYQVEARIAPAGAAWSAVVGRFVPRAAIGLGYLDGAALDVRVAPAHRLGVVGGFVPRADRLRFSTDTKRAGAYWAFGTGAALEGSLSAAADWSGGARRRTEIAGQTSWRAAAAVRLHAYGEVDLPVPDGPFTGAQLTTAYLGIQADLPLGFRGSLGGESHQALPLFDPDAPLDTMPLPGRLSGGTVTLGRTVGGVALDLSGGLMRREGDASPTMRGSLTASRGVFFASAMVMQGDLLDYRTALVRIMVPPRALPFTLSVGASVSESRSAGGVLTFRRYSVRPEIAWYLARGVFASAGGDIGTYAGQATTWLHAGVSYRFR